MSSKFHCSPFNCCLSVVLELDEEDYPENSHVVFYPNKQRSFEPLLCSFGSCFRTLAVFLFNFFFVVATNIGMAER